MTPQAHVRQRLQGGATNTEGLYIEGPLNIDTSDI